MKKKLLKLYRQLDPEIQAIVAEVIELERDYLDYLKPRGVKGDIRDVIDRIAKHGLGKESIN